jgi:hypothetical protein
LPSVPHTGTYAPFVHPQSTSAASAFGIPPLPDVSLAPPPHAAMIQAAIHNPLFMSLLRAPLVPWSIVPSGMLAAQRRVCHVAQIATIASCPHG